MLSPKARDALHRGVYREGKLLLVERARMGAAEGMPLPPLCVRCGKPAAGTIRRRFMWHPPWVYLLILPGLLFYAIVAMAVRKQLVLHVPLCAAHRTRRRNLLAASWIIALAGLAAPFLCAALGLNVGVGMLFLLLLVLLGAILGSSVAAPIRPTRIEERGGTFKGCSEAFLRNSVF
jgi:hypothetical protein